MADFFKQLIAQLTAVWQRLSLQQKAITVALVAFTFLALAGLMIVARPSANSSGFKVLYSDLPIEEAAVVTQKLQELGHEYKLENDGRTIVVKQKTLYEVRMALAREGLPKSHGIGYEIFDKTNLGMTDFVQKMNAHRALEGELQRTIEGLEEIKSARVHIVIPEETIFLEKQKDAKASVVVRMVPGAELSKDQIRGISFLVSSSVDGLKPDNISVVDFEGRLLSSPYGDESTALVSSRNLELQQNVEKYLENKAGQMLSGILGPGKSSVKIAVDLDFDRVERNLELFDPESRVIRSEERTDQNTKNAPTGDHQEERSLTNYEIDKRIEHIIQEVGNVKRLTASVALDGKYEKDGEGKKTYVARTPEFLRDIEQMVKNTVGYDVARGDLITVSNVQFDNEYLREQREEMEHEDLWEIRFRIMKYALAGLFVVLLILFLGRLAKTIAEAMNPPVPQIIPLGMPEPIPAEVSEEVKRSSELLERVEMLTKEEPVNIAAIIRQWLSEPAPATHQKKK